MEITSVILLMALVTAIPRVLPVFVYHRVKLPRWLKKWLESVPYAVLAALILPGILYVDDNMLVGLSGALVACVLTIKGYKVFNIIIGAILAAFFARLLVV